MNPSEHFDHIVILNIDGLRRDVFRGLLSESKALGKLFGDENQVIHCTPSSVVPSITFTAQATITTGESPDVHEIVGNQFFDRAGVHSKGKSKFYALDVASGIDALDAASVFTLPGKGNNLLSKNVSTIYEVASESKKISLCAYHMYSRGAHYWIRPTLPELFLLKKQWPILSEFPAWFERKMMKRLLKHLSNSSFPHLLMAYFMSLDTITHRDGPDAQHGYFLKVIDPLLCELISATERRTKGKKVLYILVSDHGHAAVRAEKSFNLRAIGALDNRLSPMQALRGKGSFNIKSSEIVAGNNSGISYLYVREKGAQWNAPPPFSLIKETALNFLNSSAFEAPFEPLSGALIRNVEEHGWDADYMGILPGGEIVSLLEYFSRFPEKYDVAIPQVIGSMSASFSGDILLLPNAYAGFSFGENFLGNHGGITQEEQECVLSLSAPGAGNVLSNVWNKVHQQYAEEPAISELQYIASIVKQGLG